MKEIKRVPVFLKHSVCVMYSGLLLIVVLKSLMI